MRLVANIKERQASYKALDSKDKRTYWKEFTLNNSLYFLNYCCSYLHCSTKP